MYNSSSRSHRRPFGLSGLRQPPVVDVGCNCRRPRLISSLLSSLYSSKPKSAPSSSSFTSTGTSTFSATTATGGATTATDSSWDPTSYTTNSLFEAEYDELDPKGRGRGGQLLPPPGDSSGKSLSAATGGRERHRSGTGGSGRRRRRSRPRRGGPPASASARLAQESVPVAVDSTEPYDDFHSSMVQMVMAKEIYAWEDLNDLLHQFLSLNSPRHHPVILHAFADLWNRNGVFSPPSPCV